MVIGCYGQGKTSLVRRLVQQPLKDVMTTNGIEVQRCKCSKDGAWEAQISEDLEVESSKRLAYVAKSSEGRINEGTGVKPDFVPLATYNTKVKENTAVTLSTTTVEENLKSNINRNNAKSNKNRNYPVNTDTKKEVTDEILKADQSDTFMDQENYLTNLKTFSAELKRHRQTSNASTESDISLNIWDFGGQFVYYATHQVFLSTKSVYILVFNIAEGLDKTISDPDFPRRSCKMTMRDYIRFWVTSVHSFVGAEDGTEPTIIMVGTHKDEIKEGINTDDIFEDIRKMFDDTSAINHFHPDQFVVSNTSLTDESIDILRKTILDVGRGQENKVAVPAKWILLEKELKKIRSKKIVTLEEVLEIDRRNYSRVQTETQDAKNDQIRLFLRYHHALGSFCYFHDRNLSEYIVVDPQFLIDAFSCIVTSEQFCRVRPKLRKKWRKLCETAILEPELLEEVWRKNSREEFHKFKKLLTEFLQKHRIISEVLKYDEEGATSPQPLGFYIVPSFLKVSASDETVGDFLDGKPTAKVSLGYIFENEALTPTLYQKLLAAVVGRWPLLKFTGQYILFNDMVACELQADHAGLLIQTQNKLELLIVNLLPVNAIRPDVCDMFRRYVEMVIEHEFCRFRGHEEHASQRVFTKYVRCFHKLHGSKGSEDILKLTDILSQSDRHFPCPDRASHSLEMNLICQQWYRHEVTIGDIPKRRLTEKQYSALSMGIGQGWQQIGRQLGLRDISLEQIDMDYKSTDMKIFYMFLKWDSIELDKATLDVLVKAVQECLQITSVDWDVVKNIVDGF
ncbi:uncharacterized protein LOC128547271 [Mercenaria mercenaria]|uniref:uncharacterized protein LOC128547271 n=1 Tax=Mercenaria mercenaria TaxID=6596 RepID=UPI00234EDA99|nr:uncharacterized protein LOC128547271 [Mercenaria mercenaria]